MRIVVKVGSAVLTQDGDIALERMQNLVDFLVKLKKENEVILVSSGAVSAGFTLLPLDRSIIQNKQALASLGQPILMKKYTQKFAKYDMLCSQVLITDANLNEIDEVKRVKNTIDILLENGVIPIVNENDATSTHELEIGDNDQLSAFITKKTDADLLIILSDIDAYYDDDPHINADAKVLKVVNEISEEELNREATPNDVFATGGIVTKLKAANFMMQHQKKMFLASGMNLSTARTFLLEGRQIGGTLFCVKEEPCA